MTDVRFEAYARAALEGACGRIRAAQPSERNSTTSKNAFGIGQYVGGGVIDAGAAFAQLAHAAQRVGLSQREAEATVRRGLAAGKMQPRTPKPSSASSSSTSRSHAVAPTPLELEHTPVSEPSNPLPPFADISRVWNEAVPVYRSLEACAYFSERRGIPPARVPDDVARVMLPGAWRPRCMRYLRQTCRVVFPLSNVDGDRRTFQIRDLDPNAEIKSMSLKGSTKGLLFACSFARRILKHGHPSTWPGEEEPWGGQAPPWWPADQPVTFVIAEGELDHLAFLVAFGDSAEFSPAVLGVRAGSWTAAFAQKIPDRSIVIVATDSDESGDKYSRAIVDTFRGRDVALSRLEL